MKKNALVFALLSSMVTIGAVAKVSQIEVDKLSTTLTPMGAERAGNQDNSIPAWTGGITSLPSGYQAGTFHLDPFAEDKVLFTIDGANYQQYRDQLTPGQQAMFATYPDTFKMAIYPTRRSASYPEHVYDATKANALRAELISNGNGIDGAAIGVPFPIPSNGLEAIWNHILRYRGEQIKTNRGQAAVTTSGDYTLVKIQEEVNFLYSRKGMTPEVLKKDNLLFYFKQVVKSPAKLAGTALLVHETLDQEMEPRLAWTYNTGQRRVRRAPNVAFDAPGTVSDGLRTADDLDMFNGSPTRYNWTLKGKQELYIPYNSYQLHAGSTQYADILQKGHINPDLVRYEKHRVWVVEAELKADINHIYKKRVFYIDEDSWQIVIADIYDNRDELYRVAMAHPVNYYDVPTVWTTFEVYYDLQSRRYLAMGLDNQESVFDFSPNFNDNDFTPSALRRMGRR